LNDVPIVDFSLLGEQDYVTAYVQVDNPQLKTIARKIKGKTPSEIIRAVSAWVAKHVDYPLDWRGKPNANRKIKLFKFGGSVYHVDLSREYGWLKPNQTATVRKGICFDTACLATSILRIKKVKAYTVIGAILTSKKRKLQGFHAWTEAADEEGQHWVIETTVHPNPPELVLAKDLYSGKFPLLYDPIIWFNESECYVDQVKEAQYEALGVDGW